jgi:hypothetical protein
MTPSTGSWRTKLSSCSGGLTALESGFTPAASCPPISGQLYRVSRLKRPLMLRPRSGWGSFR